LRPIPLYGTVLGVRFFVDVLCGLARSDPGRAVYVWRNRGERDRKKRSVDPDGADNRRKRIRSVHSAGGVSKPGAYSADAHADSLARSDGNTRAADSHADAAPADRNTGTANGYATSTDPNTRPNFNPHAHPDTTPDRNPNGHTNTSSNCRHLEPDTLRDRRSGFRLLGVEANSTIATEPITVEIDWGDGISQTAGFTDKNGVYGAQVFGSGNVFASHTYATGKAYTVKVTVSGAFSPTGEVEFIVLIS
jgi:hypothetical protein